MKKLLSMFFCFLLVQRYDDYISPAKTFSESARIFSKQHHGTNDKVNDTPEKERMGFYS